MCKTPFQQEVISKAKAHKMAVDMAFGRSFPAKNEGVTPLQLMWWLSANGLDNPKMVWDKGERRILVRYRDSDNNTRTHVMSELLELIEEERTK